MFTEHISSVHSGRLCANVLVIVTIGPVVHASLKEAFAPFAHWLLTKSSEY